MSDNVKALAAWLESIEPLTVISSTQYDELMQLCRPGSPLEALLGLLLGQRMAQLMQLSNTPLGTAEKSAVASVIQGHVRGIDAARQTLLDLAQQAAASVPAIPGKN